MTAILFVNENNTDNTAKSCIEIIIKTTTYSVEHDRIIENDYPKQFVKIWKCPTCGTLHVFSAEGSVKNVFIKDNSNDTYDYIEEGVMFGDYLWSDITDQDISND